LQQSFWGGSQAGEKQARGLKRLAVVAAGGADLHDPAGADPGLADVIRRLFCPQAPGDVAGVADLVDGQRPGVDFFVWHAQNSVLIMQEAP